MNLYPLIRPILFAQDAERAHSLAFSALGWAGGALLAPIAPARSTIEQPPVEIAGLHFKNRIGLAAGLDKNALRLDAWERLGFGHIEIGTVTPRPQPGNPKPRLFRLLPDQALINRMGFNNDGAEVIRARLEHRPPSDKLIVGGNIGKNKETPEEDAHKDYIRCLLALHEGVDYITVNISSPNTQGLRDLQSREPLHRLLSELQNKNEGLLKPRPIFVKIAPDLETADLEDIVAVADATGMAGIVATNTTLSRKGLQTPLEDVERLGAGGLSGAPLTRQSQYFCEVLSQMIPPHLKLIASGGIMTPVDAAARLAAGATLVQLYTGFVFHGPALVPACVKASARILETTRAAV